MRVAVSLIALTCISGTAAALDELIIPPASYPDIAKRGASATDFVPPGWAIERQASGDISGDGLADLALVVKQANPAFVLENNSFGAPTLDTNPRILVVALATRDGYQQVVANHRLIPRHEIPTLSDAFGDEDALDIKRGSLKISFYHFANMGGWDMGPTSFTFRWHEDALRLIGYDRTVILRNEGSVTSLSIDFLKRRVKTSFGRVDEKQEKVQWHRYDPASLESIDHLGSWDEYDPGGWVTKLFG